MRSFHKMAFDRKRTNVRNLQQTRLAFLSKVDCFDDALKGKQDFVGTVLHFSPCLFIVFWPSTSEASMGYFECFPNAISIFRDQHPDLILSSSAQHHLHLHQKLKEGVPMHNNLVHV